MQKHALNPLDKECRKNNKSNMELWLMLIRLNATRPIKLAENKESKEIAKGIPWTTLSWKYDAYNLKRGHIIKEPEVKQENDAPEPQKQSAAPSTE